MRGMKNLIRIHKSKLEAERRKLAELESVADGFTRQIEALLQSTETESRATNSTPDAAHAIGSFVQGVLARVQTLRKSLADVEHEIAEIRERIHAAFQELKRYEIAEERRLSRARSAERRRERIAEDELGLAMYRRGDRLRAG